MSTVLVWFKTDLRLRDNETLMKAVRSGNQIIPVYIFDERHYGKTSRGFEKTGAFRLKFLLESLQNLDDNLRACGSGLLVHRGLPEDILPQLAKKYGVKKVYAKKEVGTEEKDTEQRVITALFKAGCELEISSTSTLYHADDLPFSVRDIPEVFTKFRKKVEKESRIREELPAPEKILSPQIPGLLLPEPEKFGLPTPEGDRRGMRFTGGETAAWERLNYYFYESRKLAEYKETRNGLVGADYSTKFSPFLALGCISARSVYSEVRKFEKMYGATKDSYWLVFELLWRDYFRFIMKKHGKKFFLKGGLKGAAPTYPPHRPEALERWINGETGEPFIDANMRELAATGFMSNRGRQNVASYLCHHLKIDWRYGAAYFEQQLIDYDVSSNWGNWAYLAGVGNDPREERVFNPQKQAADYDPKQEYRNLWGESTVAG